MRAVLQEERLQLAKLSQGSQRPGQGETQVLEILPPCFAVCAASLQPRLTLCDPMDCSPPGSSVHGILQARILEWVAMPSSRGSSQPRDQTQSSCSCCTASRFLTTEPPREPTVFCCLKVNTQ